MSMLQPMLRHVWLATRPGTSSPECPLAPGAGTGLQCALPLLLLGVTIAGFGCAGARVDVAQQAPSDVPQPDFLIVERFAVSP